MLKNSARVLVAVAVGVAGMICMGSATYTPPAVSAKAAETAPAAQGPTALGTARGYMEMFRMKKGVQAVQTYWDFRVVAAGIFDKAWDGTSEKDKGTVVTLLQKTFAAILANAHIADVVSRSTVDKWQVSAPKGSRQAVMFTVHFPADAVVPGKSGDAANILVLEKSGDQWHVVDSGNNGSSLVEGLHGEYQKNSDMTPLVYAQGLYDLMQQRLASGK